MDYAATYAYEVLDRGYLPDVVVRRAIRLLNAQRIRSLDKPEDDYAKHIATKLEYIRTLKTRDIAIEQDKANQQHYEVDTGFMLSCLGKRAKYSCCLYETGRETLDQAEEAMLDSYCQKAQLEDGMDVLDLGCGWGSLCLYLAERYPNSRIKALSNSKTQKLYIDQIAASKGLVNLEVHTGDVKVYEFPAQSFDRILSIEMFEHMKNYSLLFSKVASWMKSDSNAKLFIHIFCHRTTPYHFEDGDGWMTQNFFSGGTMPSHDLFLHFQQHVTLEDMWWVNGTHYARTCEDWLKTQDKNHKAHNAIAALRKDAAKKGSPELEGEKTFYRFRIFYLACAEFFATNNGNEWGVGHYLFSKK
ncbi:S-adenosyl-L-methionine-dependent methyltransferase [Testicularia cyperi]|uniref:S-adenosyl-L-methionine-dependent methyltransferase n=1 Tax=Testicularia cyperi TaxID=1882483 RepID=A0A317XGF1_9BASI|nr:S-adenosyl-L-methionine-dependent methyltransferase [Testicularia cyperi]